MNMADQFILLGSQSSLSLSRFISWQEYNCLIQLIEIISFPFVFVAEPFSFASLEV